MPWEFTDHHVRPNVFYWSPKAHQERQEVQGRRKEAQASYQAAKKLISQGDAAAAEAQLEVAVAAWPDQPRFLLALAECICDHRRDPVRSLPWFNQLIATDDTAQHRAARARARAALGSLGDALADVQAALAATSAGQSHDPGAAAGIAGRSPAAGSPPSSPTAGGKSSAASTAVLRGVYLRTEAVLLERMGRYDDAIGRYAAASPVLKEAGQPVLECFINQAYCHRMMRRSDDALRGFQQALTMSPSNPVVKRLLGCTFFDQRRYHEALSMFESQLFSSPSSTATHNNVALALYRLTAAEAERAQQAAARAAVARRTQVAEARRAERTSEQQQGGGGSSSVGIGAGGEEDELSDEDEELEEGPGAAAAGGSGGQTNEDPRQWALSIMRSGGGSLMAGAGAGGGSASAGGAGGGGSGGGAGKGAAGGGGQGAAELDDAFRLQAQLLRALSHLDTALNLFERGEEARRTRSQSQATVSAAGSTRSSPSSSTASAAAASGPEIAASSSSGGVDVHALEVGQPGRALDGVLLMLAPMQRVPGHPAVHDLEVQAGELQFNRGLVHLALGRLDEAEANLAAALERNPLHAHYPHYRAVVHARRGDFRGAVHWNLAALSLNDGYFPALYHLGLVLHLLGRNAEAIHRLDTAQDAHPPAHQRWAVAEARGRVMQELDRQAEAIVALQEALELLHADAAAGGAGEPPAVHARLYYALAQSAIATHNPALFRHALRQARMHGQHAASVFNLRGLLALRERRLAKALAYLSRAVRLAPQEARFVFDRSQAHMEAGQYAEAVADMGAALELLPESASLRYHRAMALYALHDEQGALEDLEAAAELMAAEEARAGRRSTGASPGAADGSGVLRMDPRLWEGSKVLAGSPVPPDLTPSLWYHLGVVRARLGRFADASGALERAARLLPSHPAILHELAKCRQACGEYAAAREGFDRVLALQPRNAHALFRRGLAHRSLGDYARAADDMATAAAWEPGEAALRVDFKRLGKEAVIELCRPGEEMAISSGGTLRQL